MSAELSARRTAAAAVLADFKRETDKYIDTNGTVPRPDMGMWAWRLASELRSVLQRLDDEAAAQPQRVPGDVGYLGSDALAKRYGDALQRIVDADPSDAVDKLARNALGLTRVSRPKPQPAPELAEIRALLGAFDWETGDRQYALEKVDAIVNRGRS